MAIRTVTDVWNMVRNKRIQLCIGCLSAFWFIGTEDEYIRDLDLLEWHYEQKYQAWADSLRKAYSTRKKSMPVIKSRTPFKFRRVKEIYKRHCPGEPTQLVVVISGPDAGECIDRYEYRGKLVKYFNDYLNAVNAGTTPNFLLTPYSVVPEAWRYNTLVRRRSIHPPETNEENWQELANAIIGTAADDIRNDHKAVLLGRQKEISYMCKQAEAFFKTEWASFLAGGMDLSAVPDRLRRQVLEEVRGGATPAESGVKRKKVKTNEDAVLPEMRNSDRVG